MEIFLATYLLINGMWMQGGDGWGMRRQPDMVTCMHHMAQGYVIAEKHGPPAGYDGIQFKCVLSSGRREKGDGQ